MAAPDMELKAAFAELQAKMIESKQKIKIHDIQIENLKRSSTHASLTDQEISQLPEETKVMVWNSFVYESCFYYNSQVYESAGRMFLLSDIKAVRSGLDKKNEAVKEKIHTLIGNKEYLEKQIKESENNLRELVMAKKNNS